ncbi:MAG: hypothetical protein U5K28_11050 [Halobacteriales archaeon]|nr:hypothetical protein [Halobacteriales archaeon]
MTVYDRGETEDYRIVDRFDGGIGWLAHPDEAGQRASHAFNRYPDIGTGSDETGVGRELWLFDPLDAPGVDELLAENGVVAGVVICSNFHARDAATIAARHDVPVYVPPWLDRAADRLVETDVAVERTTEAVGFELHERAPIPGYAEAVAYRETDRTLYVPDVLGTAPLYLAGEERLGVYSLLRLFPPRAIFRELSPERILLGHGTGIHTDATATLQMALDTARRRFPRAVATGGRTQLRALVDALDWP